MKKGILFAFAVSGLMLLAGCAKDIEFSTPQQEKASEEDIQAHVKSVFGVTFDPNQDWCTTQSGKVTITIDDPQLEDVVKVQILTKSPFGNGDGNGAKSLNETAASFGQSYTLYYDAPKMYDRLYAACVTKSGLYYIKGFNVGQQQVSFKSTTAKAPRTRSQAGDFILADLVSGLPTPTIVNSCSSFGAERAKAAIEAGNTKSPWLGFENEVLYQHTQDYETAQRLIITDYDEDYKTDLFNMLFQDYLVNKQDNIDKIINSEYYLSNNNYPLTTGDDPIIMAPICKNDSIYHEIEYCDLYYYYFKPSDIQNKSDEEQAQYMKSLPKYRALELWNSINDELYTMTNNKIKRETAYALIFWGDGTPVVGQTTGQYTFPAGYKIGFMLRSIDTKEKPETDGSKRDGEMYADGRLNTAINQHGHFKSAHLNAGDPRMAWFWANNHNYLCCESGADRDINDIVFEVLGGLMVPPPPVVDANKYTFCFEDTEKGDYDLNDVVIRGYRKSKTEVVWQVVACGASDQVFIRNINGQIIRDDNEVHVMMGKPGKGFINTSSIDPETPFVEETVTVPETFSFLDPACQPYIFDKSNGLTVPVAMTGQDPHAVMVPYEFRYPLEQIKVCIAYPKFNSWGTGAIITDEGFKWYLNFDEKKVTKAIPTLDVTYEL